jgi:NAD(P)-dependent dehydrogenase (short-subunit alcohol dehydrogenase family)
LQARNFALRRFDPFATPAGRPLLAHHARSAFGAPCGKAAFVTLDVTTEASWLAAVSATIAQLGGFDILVNNARSRSRRWS